MENSITLTPSPDDTKEVVQGKLETALKIIEDKDRQLEHYKQLVKTLKDVLAESHSKPHHAPSSPPKSSNALNSANRSAAAAPIAIGKQPQQQQQTAAAPVGGRQRRNSRSGAQSNDASKHEWPVSSAQNLSFLSDDEEEVKDDKFSWRRPTSGDENRRLGPTSSVDDASRPFRTTTVTQPKQVTINSNPIMNSPRGLKKSVSHHALSSYDRDKESARPAAPVRGKKNDTAQSIGQTKSEDDLSKNNKLKKSQSMTSVYSVLEENRLDLKFPELDQMVGQIYALSKYQQGCRFLQKKLDENNDAHTRIILNELMDHLMELMTDPFGNYLFSKLMEHCDTNQKEQIIKKIIADLLPTAFDMYGTQSMQKMMPFLTESQIDLVVNALKPSSIALIKHNKANYLIQYCLDHLPSKHNQWIYDAVCECMDDVGRDRVGCVIVKRCIDHATDDQMRALFAEICNKALALVQDPFGNYVVQHVLDKYPSSDNSQVLIGRLVGNITDLCVQKFSSNVVEKCLKMSNQTNRHAMLAEITESPTLSQLLSDRFANFVVQTALDVAEPEDRQNLVKNIIPHLGRHYSPYTKRLQKKILQV